MYNNLSEQELIQACCKKDKLAEGELYSRYAAKIFTICKRYTGNIEEAQDLMQESLLQALNKLHTFNYKGEGSLYGWIKRIAINKAINFNKRHRWRMVPTDLWTDTSIPDPISEDIDSIPQETLLKIISTLPALRRTVFNLFCIDGYSHKEVGEILGISEKGSASILAKARKQLKEMINDYLESLK